MPGPPRVPGRTDSIAGGGARFDADIRPDAGPRPGAIAGAASALSRAAGCGAAQRQGPGMKAAVAHINLLQRSETAHTMAWALVALLAATVVGLSYYGSQ